MFGVVNFAARASSNPGLCQKRFTVHPVQALRCVGCIVEELHPSVPDVGSCWISPFVQRTGLNW